MLVELSLMEQRYQAVLAVVQDGWKVTEVAGAKSPNGQTSRHSSTPVLHASARSSTAAMRSDHGSGL